MKTPILPPKAACKDCAFAAELTARLYCRRHPPQVFVIPPDRITSSYPPVDPAGGCGEFRGKVYHVKGKRVR